MNAIIMAGGEGTRLKSVTGDTPKPMALLAGKPVLEHILALLKRNGIRNVCITLRYRPDVIRDYFGDGERFGMNIHYHVEAQPLGTAGGVKACANFYGDRDFLVISGDCACDFNLKALFEAHHRHRPSVTMALYAQDTPLQYGTVLTNRFGRVVSFIEKPAWERVVSDLVNTGIYILSPAAMSFVPEGKPFDFASDLFPGLLEMEYQILGLPMDGYWCDIGTPKAYHQCNLDALDGRLHLEDSVPDPPAAAPTQQQPEDGAWRECRCRSRARLMRALSQSLMEAGAEFSDGLVLQNGDGKVRITPATDSESVIISASSDVLAARYEELVKKLEQ